MTKKKKHASRTRIRSELKNFNTEIDTRPSRYEPEKNRFTTKEVLKKKERFYREQKKLSKIHIKNRRTLKKRFEVDLEENQSL